MRLGATALAASLAAASPAPIQPQAGWQISVQQTLPPGAASRGVWVGLTNTSAAASAVCVAGVSTNFRDSLHVDVPAFPRQRCEADRDAHLVLPRESYFVLVSVPAFRSGMIVDLVLDVVTWPVDQPISPATGRPAQVSGHFALK